MEDGRLYIREGRNYVAVPGSIQDQIDALRTRLAEAEARERRAFHVGYSVGMEDGGACVRGMLCEPNEDAEWEAYRKIHPAEPKKEGA